jgi:predicted dehydrogenase
MEISDIRVLLVGCGSIGKRHAECLNEIGVKNMTFFDPDGEKSQELVNLYGGEKVNSYEEGVEKVDAVYILSPTKLHIKQARFAVEKNKHVFLEKPLSTTLEGVDELEREAKEKGVVVGNAFCFRFHEGVEKLKKIVDSGRIGKKVSIRAMMGEHFPTVRPDYMSTYYVKYSGAFELVHDLDLAVYFAGSDIAEFYGVYGSYADLGFTSPDTVEIALKFNDCLASVHLDFFQKPRTRVFRVIGTEGQAALDFASWDEYSIEVYDAKTNETRVEKFASRRNDMFVAESLNFLNSVLGKEKIAVPISEAKKSLTVFCGLYKEN